MTVLIPMDEDNILNRKPMILKVIFTKSYGKETSLYLKIQRIRFNVYEYLIYYKILLFTSYNNV